MSYTLKFMLKATLFYLKFAKTIDKQVIIYYRKKTMK